MALLLLGFWMNAAELGRQRSTRSPFHTVMCSGVSVISSVAFRVTTLILHRIKIEELSKKPPLAQLPSFLLMQVHVFPSRPGWYFEGPRVMYSLGLVS